MDCKTCVNYKPRVQEPEHHPGRIYAEDLKSGMVIRRHGTQHERKLIVITDEGDKHFVPSLQLLAGRKPDNTPLALAASGLKPYDCAQWRGPINHRRYCLAGSWQEGAWCEEVT